VIIVVDESIIVWFFFNYWNG